MMEAKEKMHAKALPSAPTLHKEQGHIKAVGIDDVPTTPREDAINVTEIDGGILDYVRERMHCKTVTPDVRRQAAAFEREMNRQQGW